MWRIARNSNPGRFDPTSDFKSGLPLIYFNNLGVKWVIQTGRFMQVSGVFKPCILPAFSRDYGTKATVGLVRKPDSQRSRVELQSLF